MKPISLRGHIVIVEDNPELCSMLSEMIQDISPTLQVTCFTRSKDALTYLLHNPDSVCGVISDLMMSEMDGIDFLASLRKDPRTENLPFFFLSGAEPSVFSNLLRGYRFSGFIAKPIDFQALKKIIETHFRNVSLPLTAA